MLILDNPGYVAWLHREGVVSVGNSDPSDRGRWTPSAFEDVDSDRAQRYHEGRPSRPERDPSLLEVISSVPNYQDLMDEAVEDALHDMYDGSGRY